MAVPVGFSSLWTHLPQWFHADKVKPKPPETVVKHKVFTKAIPDLLIPVDWETCCIQMSHALNQAGAKVSYPNKQRVLTDKRGNEYMLDVKEMRGYLMKYGPPDNIGRVDANNKPPPRWVLQASIADRKGIIAFGGRHIDLWDGTRIHGEHYIPEAIWEDESTLKEGIFLWDTELP